MLHYINMGKKATLAKETVAIIIGLKKAGHETKEITELTGVFDRSVRKWVMRFEDEGGLETPGPKRIPGRPPRRPHGLTT